MKRNVELHIEELVLHGFAQSDRYAIGEVVKLELTRLLDERGMLPSLKKNAQIESLDVGDLNVAQGAKAEMIGAHIAEAVHNGIAHENQQTSARKTASK